MSNKWSSFGKQQTIMESWRKYTEGELLTELGEPAAAAAPPGAEPGAPPPAPAEEGGGSWPAKPSKTVKITAGSGLDRETILGVWQKLAAMNPPNDPAKVLASIGGPEALVANVQGLEKNFAGSAKNPARIDMPVVDPDKDMGDLKGRLAKGELDVKPPFAPDLETTPDENEFPRGLDKADDPTQDKWLSKGLRDKNPTDDSAVSLAPTPINVVDSYPTQSEVYLDKSMWNILNFGPTKKGGTAHGKPNLIAIQDGKNNYILDGHHRWSSAWISGGPAAKINVQALVGLDVPTAIAALRTYGNARDNSQKG